MMPVTRFARRCKRFVHLVAHPFALLILPVLFLSPGTARAQFSDIGANLTGVGDASIAWADYDKDGDLDLLVAGHAASGAKTTLYKNTSGNFSAVDNLPFIHVSLGEVTWGDYDNDGDPDLLLTGQKNDGVATTQMYRNNGNGTFTDINAGITAMKAGMADWGDYDKDGDLDFFISGVGTDDITITKVYRNNGNGSFSTIGAGLKGLRRGDGKWVDYDKDDDLDLLLTGRDTQNKWWTILYKNNNGSFVDSGVNFPDVDLSAVDWADFDADGHEEILIAGTSGSGLITRLYDNPAQTGGSAHLITSFDGVEFAAAGWGDYDNDGYREIAIMGRNASNTTYTRIYNWTGGTSFNDVGAGLIGLYKGSLDWGDFDNDGDLDLAVAGFNASDARFARIYRNDLTFNTGPWTRTDNMHSTRRDHTATLLLDRNVLIVDGTALGAELYNTATGTFSYLSNPVYSHLQGLTSTRLLDGRVLITGGNGAPNSAEIYDPVLKSFKATNHMLLGRSGHSATLLSDGKVLIAGGKNGDYSISNAEIFDPETGTFAFTGNMIGDRVGHSATQLLNGKVLIIGGTHVTSPGNGVTQTIVEVYDPVTKTFRKTKSMYYTPSGHAATLLENGEVLVTRGSSPSELFDPAAEQFRATSAMRAPRRAHSATLLNNGTVLLAGGSVATGPVTTNSAEIFDPATETFQMITPMFSNRQQHTATLMPDGDVLVAGGYNGSADINQAEIYDAPPPTPVADFSDSGIDLTAVDEAAAAWADYDNDNDLDLLVAGTSPTGPLTRLYRNTANTLVDAGFSFQNLDLAAMDWGDYDNDGLVDFILTGRASTNAHTTLLFRNTGTSFNAVSTSLPGLLAGAADWGDFDNDGDLDLLLTGRLSNLDNFAGVFKNINGTFTDINAGLTGLRRGQASWVDYDVDGDLDILLTGRINDAITRRTLLYRNAGGAFEEVSDGLPDVDLSSIDWGDYDSDGDPDLLLTGTTGGQFIARVYRNNITSFTDIGTGLTGVQFSAARWGDADNDGDLDILLSGSTGIGRFTEIYRNNGGSFTAIGAGLSAVSKSAAAWGDYDKDGDLDVFVTGQISDTQRIAKLYKNTTASANTAPSAPDGLTHATAADYLLLSWGQGTDAQTPQAGLSYNIRVGTTPGGSEIIAPHSLTNGWRQLTSYGNVHQNRSWKIKPLAPGLYYWSVQSIDHSFTGSSFAAEKSFFLSDPILPVELTTFESRYDNGQVILTWTTAGESDNAGFEVERAMDGESFERIAFEEGHGSTVVPQSYSVEDTALPYSATVLHYRLKQIDFDGRFAYSPVVTVAIALPDEVNLLPNYPNPFNPSTQIRYELPAASEVRLAVYDLTGKEVAVLVDQAQAAGQHQVSFDGGTLASGVYLYRLETDAQVITKRMTLVK